jgi:hypothetical protein
VVFPETQSRDDMNVLVLKKPAGRKPAKTTDKIREPAVFKTAGSLFLEI